MASKSAEPKQGLRTSRSFTRQESQPPEPLTRTQRANTFQNGSTKPPSRAEPDAFETPESDEPIEPPRASVDMDDIPIELVSKIDNFIDSLSAKVHAAPPNIDDISRRFQDFYNTAAQLIQTHISSLSTIQNRTPRPSVTTRPSAASILRAKAAALGSKEKAKAPEAEQQQMLTPDELANRKKARKALEQKRFLLEEAVERRLCEGIYDRIYRHRTTQDEAQDDKLRSKTAALAVVGIGPTDLGVDIGELPEDNIAAVAKKQEEISLSLEQARKDLTLMTEKRYPLAKLNCLKATHKSIVDTLSHFHPSSSADEIMPMLIYTLITMPPEKLHVVSDSKFIERFRWEEKLDGEAAYCLTNLEAAINFLETVDLASLRASEALSGPPKRENSPDITKTETFPPAYTAGISATSSTPAIVTPASASGLKAPPSPTSARAAAQRRRLSDLIQTPAQAIGSARDSFFDTADQSIKNITNSLGDSYKFWLGKIREDSKELVVPKTLEDARKLIGTPPPDDDDTLDTSSSSRRLAEHDALTPGREDRMLSLVGGRKASIASRDRSADSTRSARSASSSKKVVFSEDNKEKTAGTAANPLGISQPVTPSLVDQARNLGNSLNPMNKFSGMIRPFGRSVTTPVPSSSTPPPKDAAGKPVDGGDLATAFPDLAAALPPKEVKIPQIKPPNKRFIELQNPADLKLGEVLELLRDYRRLAGALKDMGAFKET